jgi:hypothetical protein
MLPVEMAHHLDHDCAVRPDAQRLVDPREPTAEAGDHHAAADGRNHAGVV